MDKIIRDMIRIYEPLDYDWMNYKITRKEDITYHHIVKKLDGGIRNIENGALLTSVSHQYLHLIECKDINTYEMLNDIFHNINKQKRHPTIEQQELIEYILQNFEYRHRNDKNKKGKSLIQYKYKKRF